MIHIAELADVTDDMLNEIGFTRIQLKRLRREVPAANNVQQGLAQSRPASPPPEEELEDATVEDGQAVKKINRGDE